MSSTRRPPSTGPSVAADPLHHHPDAQPDDDAGVLLQIIASLKIFDQVYLMTAGGPGTSTQVVLGLVTNTAFTDYRVGAASAASVLLFIVIIVIAALRQLTERSERTA